jgi:hypothetical protein
MTHTSFYRLILTAFIALNCLSVTTVTASPKVADVELQLLQIVQNLTSNLNAKNQLFEPSLDTPMYAVYNLEAKFSPTDQRHLDLLIFDTWLSCLALIDLHMDKNSSPNDEPRSNIPIPRGMRKDEKIRQAYIQEVNDNERKLKLSHFRWALRKARGGWVSNFELIIRGYFPKPDNANLVIIPHKIKAVIPEGDTRDQLIKTLKRMWGITKIQSK